jgi:4-hydroxy-4-methyl-2-oxoglutarate aldolase
MSAYAFFERPTVRVEIERPDGELVARARAYGSATLHEAAGKIGALPPAIKPAVAGFTVCGPAITVRSPASDNVWFHRAMVVAQPGDVLVVTVDGVYDHGYWGEIMSHAARARKLGGLVLDGCVRDAATLGSVGFPVFARGLAIEGTNKDFAAEGWINFPLPIGKTTIEAGDLIAGDVDGVVAIPRAALAATLEAARAREEREVEVIRKLEAGMTTLELYAWPQ